MKSLVEPGRPGINGQTNQLHLCNDGYKSEHFFTDGDRVHTYTWRKNIAVHKTLSPQGCLTLRSYRYSAEGELA